MLRLTCSVTDARELSLLNPLSDYVVLIGRMRRLVFLEGHTLLYFGAEREDRQAFWNIPSSTGSLLSLQGDYLLAAKSRSWALLEALTGCCNSFLMSSF